MPVMAVARKEYTDAGAISEAVLTTQKALLNDRSSKNLKAVRSNGQSPSGGQDLDCAMSHSQFNTQVVPEQAVPIVDLLDQREAYDRTIK